MFLSIVQKRCLQVMEGIMGRESSETFLEIKQEENRLNKVLDILVTADLKYLSQILKSDK